MTIGRAETVRKNNAKPETKARKHKWYIEHREQVLAASKKWADNNRERRREIALRYVYKTHFGGNRPTELKECKLCGSNKRLHVHHRDGNNGRNGKPANNNKDNLVVLCNSCHARVHNHGRIRVLV